MQHFIRPHRMVVPCACMLVVTVAPASAEPLPAGWDHPHAPFRVYGNSYYVGTQALSAVLVTSSDGHVLIDGTVPTGAGIVADNIRALGFRVEDVELILNTHVHFDHAGGIAELQRQSGARVVASAASATVLTSGKLGPDDPQHGELPDISPVSNVRVVDDGEALHLGPLTLSAHFTPGHTPGGTSWSWRSCEGERCLNVVYADSLAPVSAAGYLYTDAKRNPNGFAQMELSFAKLGALPCDVLIAPHPESFGMAEKLVQREGASDADAFIDATACTRYVEAAREQLRERVAAETGR